MSSYLNVSQVAANMRVLGYGKHRAGVWTQGCSIGCPGCISLHTHDQSTGHKVAVVEIISWLRSQKRPVNGLTISGGEPTEQLIPVLKLITAFRDAFPGADVLLYSGLPWKKINKQYPELTNACDVVIAGPYVKDFPPLPLMGSSNQTIHLMTNLGKYRYQDLDQWAIYTNQILFSQDKVITVGIPGPAIKELPDTLSCKGINMHGRSWDPFEQESYEHE